LLEEAEGDALARDAEPEPLQGLAPLLPCCVPPAQPSQSLQWFCWHFKFCNVLLALDLAIKTTKHNMGTGAADTEHAEVDHD